MAAFDQRGQFINNAPVNIGGGNSIPQQRKLFAGAIHATRGNGFISWRPFACVASGLEVAIGMAVLECKSMYPADDYFNQAADMVEVPMRLINEVVGTQ